MSLAERVASSQVSDDLSEARTLESISDVDVVRACGMVANENPIGLALWRLKYTKDTREITGIMTHFIEYAMTTGLREDKKSARHFVATALRYWIDPLCENCDGLGYLKITGCPMLSDQPCLVCKGTGKIAMPDGDDMKILLDEIDKLERQVASRIFSKLSD